MLPIKQRKSDYLTALQKSLGNISQACKMSDIPRRTVYNWIDADEAFKNELRDIEEMALDFVESKLFQQISENNTAATIFYLKTKGRKRGYVERQEIDNVGKPQIVVQPLSQEAMEGLDRLL